MIDRVELAKFLGAELLDIHSVAEMLHTTRSGVNVLLVRPSSNFPRPIFETSGEGRRPVRLWLRADIESWLSSR